MEGLKNFNVVFLLPYEADADAVRDRRAKKHFRHRSIVVAASPAQVVSEVRKTGGIPIEIRAIKHSRGWLHPVSRDYKQQFMLAIYFTTQAGLSAGRALKLVIEAENGPLRHRLNYAYLILDAGGSFLEAINSLDFFDQTTLAIMEAGEKTGKLPIAINTAVDYLHARAGIVKVLLSTAIFTSVEIGFSILSLIANRVAVLPGIEKEVTDGVSPEKIAAIKKGISVAYLANDLMLTVSVVGIVFAAICTYGYLVGGSVFRQKVDDIILRIPLVKDIITHGAIANSSKVAVSLIRGGVDLMAAITIAEKSSRVPRIITYWRSATKRIEDGEDIATALAQNPLENSERTLVRSHTDRSQLARTFEVIAERREVLALRAAKNFQIFSFFATLAFSLMAVLIALAVALIQNEGLMSNLNAQ